MKKSLYGAHNQKGRTALEESKRIFGEVVVVMDVLYTEHLDRPCPEYVDVHLVCEVIARMFSGRLMAQHGCVYQFASRKEVNRFENPEALTRHGKEVTLFFKKDHIEPVLGYVKVFAHSWIVHKESGTIIDLIPLGAEPGVDYPSRHALNACQPPFNLDPKFELLKGKLPNEPKVRSLWMKLEAWVRESGISSAFLSPSAKV
jgi:hypothetical protein